MKVLCSHLLNGIMDQALRSVCVDLLCSLDESFSCSSILPLTCLRSLPLWKALVSAVFIFGSDILVKASVVFVVCVRMEQRNDKHVNQKVQCKNNAV